ncbi:MAG TPA: TIGR02300 family protein [Sphingomonas sp.]|nr:TIGR02300 family protein [Sphingomonas sp.]
MVKPEWGTKRTCPKCATRFYDLGNDEPVTCIECGTTWMPEPILKSKQPLPFDQGSQDDSKKKDAALAGGEDEHDDEDLNIDEDDDEASPDDEVDLGGDDDLGVNTSDEDEEN